MANDYQNIATLEPGKRGGKPCIRGLRITFSRDEKKQHDMRLHYNNV